MRSNVAISATLVELTLALSLVLSACTGNQSSGDEPTVSSRSDSLVKTLVVTMGIAPSWVVQQSTVLLSPGFTGDAVVGTIRADDFEVFEYRGRTPFAIKLGGHAAIFYDAGETNSFRWQPHDESLGEEEALTLIERLRGEIDASGWQRFQWEHASFPTLKEYKQRLAATRDQNVNFGYFWKADDYWLIARVSRRWVLGVNSHPGQKDDRFIVEVVMECREPACRPHTVPDR